MTRVRIIGVGTRDGDDRAGLDMARQLAAAPPAGCEVITTDRPGAELIDLLRGACAAIVLDAVHSGRPPGTIHDLALGELRMPERGCSSHGIGIAEAVALAAALRCLPPGRLIGIEATPARARPGDGLSAPVAAAMGRALERVQAWARRLTAHERAAGRRCA